MKLNTPHVLTCLWLIALSFFACVDKTRQRLCNNLDIKGLAYFEKPQDRYFESFFVDINMYPQFDERSYQKRYTFLYEKLAAERPDFKEFATTVDIPVGMNKGGMLEEIVIWSYAFQHGYDLEGAAAGQRIFSRILGTFPVSLEEYPAIADLVGMDATEAGEYPDISVHLVNFLDKGKKGACRLWIPMVRGDTCISPAVVGNEVMHAILFKEWLVGGTENEKISYGKRSATKGEVNEFLSNAASIGTIVYEWGSVTEFPLFIDDVYLYCQAQAVWDERAIATWYYFSSKFAWYIFRTYAAPELVQRVEEEIAEHKRLREKLITGTDEELIVHIEENLLMPEQLREYCIARVWTGKSTKAEKEMMIAASVDEYLHKVIIPLLEKEYVDQLTPKQQTAIAQEYMDVGKGFVGVLKRRAH